ncbi:hypothetical protein [Nocardia sp. NPDC020380]|uniref:hypothetical protein n=1 Tax=Nocardia sp. NPDC020380 TaxID=3364309 RepID=UPI00378A7212
MIDSGSAPPTAVADVVSAAVAVVRDRLPTAWSLAVHSDARVGEGRADGAVSVRAPDGQEVDLIVEAKALVEVRDVAAMRIHLATLTGNRPGSVAVVVSRYLSQSVREQLASAGLSYVDATGNIRLQVDSPALFVSDRGADSDPWRGPGRPRTTMKGEPATKVVRALLDFVGPWKVRELVRVSGASTGSVYRVIEFLEAEGLAIRDGGVISIPDWVALLRRWSKDYQFLHTNEVTRWIAPRGIPAFLDTVRGSDVEGYAVTGSVAAATWAPHAPTRSAMVYAADPEIAAKAWDLRATDTGANVLIARPAYPVVLTRSVEALEGVQVAAPAQVAVDLMTGPGRAPAEAEELLDWMERNEQSWR